MFCPPDYVLVSEILRLMYLYHDENFSLEGLGPTSSHEEIHAAINRRDARVSDAVINLLESSASLSVCSPSGIVLKISQQILKPKAFMSGTLFNFEYISEAAGSFIVDTNLDAGGRVPEAVRGQAFEGTDAEKQMVDALLQEDTERRQVFSAFNGWAITIREDDLPAKPEDMKRFFQEDIDWGDQTQQSGTTPKPGRRRKQENAREAYERLYPSGHGAIPWEIVRRHISSQLNEEISLRTIQRALER